MIWELLLKTFIPVSRIFDNEDDIFIFSRNVRKSSASENSLKKNKIKNIMKYLLYTNASKNNRWLLFVISEWFVWN